jgi:hypothetical protein
MRPRSHEQIAMEIEERDTLAASEVRPRDLFEEG